MKTIEINLYKFSELSEESKQKAIENLWDLNVDYDWWNFVYEDAENIGLKITGFDIGQGNYCNGETMYSHTETADLILKNHGETCGTYKTAKSFINKRDELVKRYSDGKKLDIVAEEYQYDFDQDCDYLESEFLKDLLSNYLSILSKEYNFLTTENAIIETIEANDYDFTENGEIY